MSEITVSKSDYDQMDNFEWRLYCYYRFLAENGRAKTTARETSRVTGLSSTKLIAARKSLEAKGFIGEYKYVRGGEIEMT